MKEGLETHRISRYDSYVGEYYAAENMNFRRLNYRIHMIVNTTLDYSDVDVQTKIANVLDKVQALPSIVNDESLIENWLEHYLNSSQYSEEQFMFGLQRFMAFNKKSPLPMNVLFDEEGEIICSRFMFQTIGELYDRFVCKRMLV